jgi:hypothetical protein
MSHLKTLAISWGEQPTASKPAQIAPALLPAIRRMFFSIPQSSRACQMKMQKHVTSIGWNISSVKMTWDQPTCKPQIYEITLFQDKGLKGLAILSLVMCSFLSSLKVVLHVFHHRMTETLSYAQVCGCKFLHRPSGLKFKSYFNVTIMSYDMRNI